MFMKLFVLLSRGSCKTTNGRGLNNSALSWGTDADPCHSSTEQLHRSKVFLKLGHIAQSVNFKLVFVLCLWFPLCLCSAGAPALQEPISLTLWLSWAVIHCRFCYNTIELNYQIALLAQADFRAHQLFLCLSALPRTFDTSFLVVWDRIRTKQDRNNKTRVW